MSDRFLSDTSDESSTDREPSQRRPNPHPDAAPARQVQEVHLLDHVRVLHKRRRTVVTVFFLIMLAVTVSTYTATSRYEATVQLLIETDDRNVISFQEVIAEQGRRAGYYETQYSILRSRTLARMTLDALNLWDHPEFGGEPEEETFSLTRTLSGFVASTIDWVAQNFSSADAADVAQAPSETAAESGAIDALLGKLTVSPVRNSLLVNVAARSPDPVLAADIANTLAGAYIEQNLELKFLASQDATDWLSDRLAEQRAIVEASERALQRYREQNDAGALEDRQNIVVQRLSELNAVVTRAKTERLNQEARYRQLVEILELDDRNALDAFPAILANRYIQQLKGDLALLQRELAQQTEARGDRHPEVIRVRSEVQTAEQLLEAEIQKVVDGERNQYEAAQTQERSLVEALEVQTNNALALDRRGIEYGVLRRDAESNRQIYESLLQRTKETGISGELRTSNIRIVDLAEVPRLPFSPRRSRNLLLGLLGGSLFGVGFAFFFDYIDNRLKTPDEIKEFLGLPSLGMIPAVRHPKHAKGDPLLSNGVPPQFAEAFRTVRTNMLFSNSADGMQSVVVTSTGPGEGKTVVACNTAIGLAQAGQRVLLVDADMRKPRVHQLFEQKQALGLSNFLVGNATARDTITKSGVDNLWTLPAGRIPPNPSELLGSNRFEAFLNGLAQHFDWVVIDCPPVMAVTDATVVAHVASSVVFVVGAEMTNKHAAETALGFLDGVGSRYVGAVLNRVDLAKNSYYYSQYYRREYAEYYSQSA